MIRSPRRDEMERIARFIVVGLGASAVTFVVFRLVLGVVGTRGLGPVAAQACGSVLGIAVSFVGQRTWTFRRVANPRQQLTRFLAVQGACMAASSALVGLGVAAHVTPNAAWVLATGLVTATSFALQRYWVFA